MSIPPTSAVSSTSTTRITRFTHTAALLAAFALLAPAPAAFALINIARGTIDLETTLAGSYESYFIGSTTNDPDFIYSVAPVLQFQRMAGLASIHADAGMTFTWYDKNTQYNSSFPSASVRIHLPTQPGSRLDGNVSLSYAESTEVDYSLNDRIPTKSLNGSVNFNFRLGDKTSLHESAAYTKLLREGSIYSDQTTWSNRFGFLYNDFLYGTNLSLDYDYTKTDTSGDNYLHVPLDQTDNAFSFTLSHPIYDTITGSFTYGYHIFDRGSAETAGHTTRDSSSFVGFGITGPFLPPRLFPKLTSHASLYYRASTSAGLNYNDNATLTGIISLSWAARARTSLSFNAQRDTTLNAADFSVINTTVGFGVTELVGDSTSIIGNVNYRWSQYQGIDRKDDFLTADITGSHTINKNWSTSLRYEFQHNQNTSSGLQPTPQRGANYDRHIVTLSLVAKF